MADNYLPDTPVVSRRYCPGCEPDADPDTELLDVSYCERHAPQMAGSEDEAVISGGYLSGSGEAGGDDNRKWCELFHGRST